MKKQIKFLITFFWLTTLLSTSYAFANNDDNSTVSTNYKNDTKAILTVPNVDSNSTITKIPSPREQTEQGVPPLGIICNLGFQLILKQSDGSPACVEPDSIDKLVERGWAQSQDWRNHD